MDTKAIFISFEEALKALKEGKPISRAAWQDCVFIYQQVPATIAVETISKMQSIPDSVKNILVIRDSPLFYCNQITVVTAVNNMHNYTFSSEDLLADDWFIYKGV